MQYNAFRTTQKVCRSRARAAMVRLGCGVLFGLALGWTWPPRSFGQGGGAPAIRVEAREVVVPAFVTVKRFEEDDEVLGLTAQEFHVFEDGKEQRVESVSVERWPVWTLQDNLSPALLHEEYSCTARGIWMGPDIPFQRFGSRFAQQSDLHSYFISYVPPPSPKGSCHRIKVQVDHRPKVNVYARDEYCTVSDSLFDSLSGTKLGGRMERYADSAKAGNLPVWVQVGVLFGDSRSSLVQIATGFPWKSLKRGWSRDTLYADLGLMGIVHDKQGQLITRLGDMPCGFGSGRMRWNVCGNCGPHNEQELELIPDRYQTQVPLSAGDYELEVVISDSVQFGRLKVPLKVDSFDLSRLEVSGIVLCKRFHDVLTGPAQYRRLVSKDVEFVPAADTRFQRGDRLFAFFQINQPLPTAGMAPGRVQFQLRIVDARTEELKMDTGLRAAESWVQPGNPIIPIAEEIAIDRLPAGTYRLEARASDSAGQETPRRTTSFTVE